MFNNKPSLLDRYEDPTGEFSNQSLRAATWYAKHRATVRTVVITVLTVWSVGTLGTSLFFIGKYAIFDYQVDRANLKNLSYSYLPTNVGLRFQPQDLSFTATRIFPGVEGQYDIFAEVNNPNRNWIAEVSYRFTLPRGVTETREALVLPNTQRSLFFLGYESGDVLNSAVLDIVSVTWKRIDPHIISDPVAYYTQRIDTSVSDFSYLPTNQTENIAAPIVSFSITNNSVFDFWEFPVLVRFERAGQLIGVAPVTLSQFMGGEVRQVSLGVFSEDVLIDGVIIEPLVNVFDSQVFMN